MSRSHDILQLAFGMGRATLENGGETYRAEETIDRMARAHGMTEAESFVVPTGIMVSMTDSLGETHSMSRRIMRRTIDLDKVARVNALARSLERAPTEPADALEKLRAIAAAPEVRPGMAMLLSGLIAAFFTLFFGGQLAEFAVSLITGVAVAGLLAANRRAGFGDFFGNAAGGIVAALAPILAVQSGVPLAYDTVIIGAIMLLVPGIAIVNAIRDTISGEILSGTARAVEALVLAMGIALGTGIVLKMWFLLGGDPALAGGMGRRAALEPFCAAVATYGFARLFNVPRREALVSALEGGWVWGLFLLARRAGSPEPASLFLAALGAGLISEVLAKGFKKPVTLFMVPGIIPLVPGANLYRAMVELVAGRYDAALREGAHALVLAGAIATGLALSASLGRVFARVRRAA